MSQSQIDRMNLNNSSYATVIKFLDLIVEKIEKGVGLETDLESNLKKMISPVDPENEDTNEERLSPNQQINLYLGLLKYKSELSAPIINVLKEAVKVNVVNNSNSDGQGNGNPFPIANQGEIYTKEDIQKAKGLLALSDKLQASEISLDEIEQLIKEKKNK
jgi:hypothetical protein